jgi:hypothetical protein
MSLPATLICVRQQIVCVCQLTPRYADVPDMRAAKPAKTADIEKQLVEGNGNGRTETAVPAKRAASSSSRRRPKLTTLISAFQQLVCVCQLTPQNADEPDMRAACRRKNG